jgi:hypothetical protein
MGLLVLAAPIAQRRRATRSRAVSQDALLYFRIKGGAAADTIRVTWIDKCGERRTDEARIMAAP